MKPSDYYNQLIADMQMGSERAVLRVCSFHIGVKNAIQKDDLIRECANLGTHFRDERQVRRAIVELRKWGIPICSSSGDSGYFLAASFAEYREFRGREYVTKIIDMQETVKAMDEQVNSLFRAEYEAYQKQKAAAAGQPALL